MKVIKGAFNQVCMGRQYAVHRLGSMVTARPAARAGVGNEHAHATHTTMTGLNVKVLHAFATWWIGMLVEARHLDAQTTATTAGSVRPA